VRQAVLPPYFGEEGANLLDELRAQKRFLRDWLAEQHVYILARREIAFLRKAAFVAEGLV
jgi:hypothetical protein